MNAITQLTARPVSREALRQRKLVDHLRAMVAMGPDGAERFHAVFLGADQDWLADTPMGAGGRTSLSLRMRDLFRRALALDASAIVIAHNHPSGSCRPSRCDIEATRRLSQVARALDIELVDHLIFTQDAIYSMRAGGNL